MINSARMKTSDVAERILHFNQGRQPELLRMKLERLRKDAFVFLRGTCPRWRQDLIRAAQEFHDRVMADYQAYCAAYDRGLVGTKSCHSSP